MTRRPPRSTLFPYTTLFRSENAKLAGEDWERITQQYGTRVFSAKPAVDLRPGLRSEEHTSELQSHSDLVCRLLLEKKKKKKKTITCSRKKRQHQIKEAQ